ncbi:MAG: ADP-forming succinate--CoA ligase subunit beta [Candidatus Eisenbacteria bacterium]|uniref:Succinate--CoA ligase [ADP-forming] subunit beta n=1 Tax=Eiseniibacteriota bacterium TaxID=2212470 RepID=A0A9D6L8G9_UNCEI|nr:ADP-forming succinate--CoA ligase subunit beta [Candidatus Eisenbacteria bacterium]
MNLHEYQGRELFARHGIPVLPGQVAATAEEARDIAETMGSTVVIKAQVLVGGRGKAGGVKLASTPDEAYARARDILALTIKGLPVHKVLVAQAATITREMYVAIVLDRAKKLPLIMLSAEGGVEIEEVARTAPERITRRHIPLDGLRAYQARALFQPLLEDGPLVQQAADILLRLWAVYRDGDCSLAEINPLVVTGEGKVMALDAKVIVDDNAEYRHREWATWRDPAEESPSARKARERGLSYVKLDGDIGCVVNGAGLAMATMDLIKHYGGEPANFLDIGGSSNPEKVTAALEIITGDSRDASGASRVRAIFFNIFGGITRCDDVARGIVQSLAQNPLPVPLVIRLTGTNEAAARKILSEAGLSATTSMDEGVRDVIARGQEVTA